MNDDQQLPPTDEVDDELGEDDFDYDFDDEFEEETEEEIAELEKLHEGDFTSPPAAFTGEDNGEDGDGEKETP